MKSGIYCIINTQNNKIYVGQSSNLVRRRYSHFRQLRNGIHYNSHLQNSFNLYGQQSFEFVVLEKVESNLLLEREQHWLDLFSTTNDVYNIKLNVGDTCYGSQRKPLSEEIKLKISNSLKGRKLSNTTIIKMKIAQSKENNNFFGKTHSEATKLHLSNLRNETKQCVGENNGRSKLTRIQVNEIREKFAAGGITQKELAKLYGIKPAAVNKIIKKLTWKD